MNTRRTVRAVAALILAFVPVSAARASAAVAMYTEPAFVVVASFPSLSSSAGDVATGSILIRVRDGVISYSSTLCGSDGLRCDTTEQIIPATALVGGPGPGDLTFVAEDPSWGHLEMTFWHEGRTPLRDACADRASRSAYVLETAGDVAFGQATGDLGVWHIRSSGCTNWAANANVQYLHG